MKIKDISYLDLGQAFVHPRITIDLGQWFERRFHLRYFLSGALSILLFRGAKPFKQFCKRASWGTFMCRYVKFGPVVQEMSFEDTSYLELWQPLCSVDWKHLCNFGGRHHEEQYCTIILNLDQRVQQEMRLKAFFIWSSGCPPVQWS